MIALLRPAKQGDLEDFMLLGASTSPGMTSITDDYEKVKKRLTASEYAFTSDPIHADKSLYLFALELDGIVIGMSAIISHIATTRPFYAYHRRHELQTCSALNIERSIESLHFIETKKKPTEMGSLLLLPEYRARGLGKLLSLGRFLFIASYPHRFDAMVIAELRGISHKNGTSPFWEAIGERFFAMPFSEADQLRTTKPEIIPNLFPKYPIYSLLLPKEAQECIGEIHPHTLPAKKILEEEGFKKSAYIDIFDAGPHFYAKKEEIKSIKESKVAKVVEITKQSNEKNKAFICNEHLEFRAVYSSLHFSHPNHCILEQEVADKLKIGVGDQIRYRLCIS